MDTQLRSILQDAGGLVVPAADLAADADLFALGLGSLAMVRVMLAIEQEFGIEFPDALLIRSTFRSIAALRDAVGQVQGGEAVA